ncbi:MAG: hypothetical protein ABJR05_04740 [Balneola sp.]
MTNKENPYRIYLDHNIYDDLSKNRYTINSDKDFKLVFSGVTLEEIARTSEKYREGFLKVINEYDSEYIWIEKGLAYFKEADAFEQLEEYLNNNEKYPGQKELFDLALKLHGGKEDVNFDDLVSNQKKAFSDLLNSTLDDLDEVEQQQIKPLIDIIKNQGGSVFDLMQDTLEHHFTDNKVPNPRKGLEEITGLSSLQLNNISTPNILQTIFERIRENNPDNETFKSPEDYFDWGLYNVKEDDIYGKINVIFNFLNMVGYWPDKKIEQENKFRAAMSDSQHAGYVAFTNEFFTRDEGFAKRMNAVFEYLNIGTKITYFTLNQINGSDG